MLCREIDTISFDFQPYTMLCFDQDNVSLPLLAIYQAPPIHAGFLFSSLPPSYLKLRVHDVSHAAPFSNKTTLSLPPPFQLPLVPSSLDSYLSTRSSSPVLISHTDSKTTLSTMYCTTSTCHAYAYLTTCLYLLTLFIQTLPSFLPSPSSVQLFHLNFFSVCLLVRLFILFLFIQSTS